MPGLPSGTVTLLFTDIEGSTRLLHELGDRFFVAFAKASQAVAAAVAAQRRLAGHAWPGTAVRSWCRRPPASCSSATNRPASACATSAPTGSGT